MLDHGVPFRLNSRVRRLVAPNPGVMTGAGTNTYLLGNDQVAVVIGSENTVEGMEACSLVTSAYLAGDASGSIVVLWAFNCESASP